MTYMVPHIVVLIIDNFKKIMNLHNSISYACTILSRHLGVLGGFLFFKQKRFSGSKRNLLHCVPDKISDKFMERKIYRAIFPRSVNVQNPRGAARPPFGWMKVNLLIDFKRHFITICVPRMLCFA